MINLDDIRGRSVLSLLEKYTGKNPYIKKLKNEYSTNKGLILTKTQVDYIITNHDKEPLFINRILTITPYLGEQLKEQHGLPFVPPKILVQYILADTDKTYHVYGKLTQKQKESGMYWLPKTQVLDDPYFEEVKIDVDFTQYNDILAKTGRKLYKHQEDGIKFLLSRNRAILGDQMGLGKAEFIDNEVFTPNGRKKIGEIKVNDKIIGSDGLPYNVTGVFPQGIKDLYRVTFNDGYSVLVGAEHLWCVSSRTNGENCNAKEINRYSILSTEQMLNKNMVITQNGIGHNIDKQYKFSTYYKEKNGNLKWQIPIVKPIEFDNEYSLPIEPYLLGLILGDGYIQETCVRIGVHKDDFNEMFNNVLLTEIKSSNKNLRICNIKLGNSIRKLQLNNSRSGTKFIPELYKYTSIIDRLSLLQGLMDTDGHCMIHKGNKDTFHGTEYCTVSEQLANDVAEIVHSLGGIVRKHSRIGAYTKNGIKHLCKKVYKLNIKMPEGINPFRLTRKSNAYNSPKKYKVGRYIKDIKLEKKGEAVCISVDSPNNLYVTEHGIVTHNTTQSIVAALESGAQRILVICPSSLKINWKHEIKVFCDDVCIVDGNRWKVAKFTIINYDILKNFHTIENRRTKMDENPHRELVNENFDLIIIDESHYLKSKDSNRSRIVSELCLNFNPDMRVFLLTGSPISNKVMDFYNLLKLIKAPIADNWVFYSRRYCEGKQFMRTLKNGRRKQIWVTDGASNLEELSLKTKNHILRRLSEEVLDLPDKIVIPVYHELSESSFKKYNELWNNYLIKREEEGKRVDIDRDLVELILLRKFIAMEAIPSTIELTENAIEEGKKVIIFTSFTEELLELQKHFDKRCVIHYGPMNTTDKQKSVDRFETDDNIKVFIGNIVSAGTGLTLVASNLTIFNSFLWSPGENSQAEFRNFRIGQKNNVTIMYQLFINTISVRMWEALKNKELNISTVLNDGGTK